MARVSRAELERRWGLVRDHLKQRGLGALVVQGYEEKIGGYVRWLTGMPPGYPRTIVFHVDDWMTSIEHGPDGERSVLDDRDESRPGIGEVTSTWALHGAAFTDRLVAEATMRVLRARGHRRIGLANAGALPHGFMQALLDFGTTDGVELTNETDAVDFFKARKSGEEIASLKETTRIQDLVFGRLLDMIRPGLRDFEINAFLDYELQLLGADRGVYIAASAPVGERGLFAYRCLQARTLQRGDYVNILVESNGPGGEWAELGRPIVLGKATAAMRDAFEVCKEAQARTARLVVPGADPAAIFEAHNRFMVAHGSEPERRIHCHGMGYDTVERPLIRADETMALPTSLNLAIHPLFLSPSVFMSVCDNYLLDEGGTGMFLHETPKQLFEIH